MWGGLGILAVVIVAVTLVAVNQAGSPAGGSSSGGSAATDFPLTVSPGEAAAKRDSGALILDVRDAVEWNDFHIPGATLIPLSELPNRISELRRDKVIIVVCRSGSRSATGRDLLRKAGFTQVTSLMGGVTQWKAQGYPTVSGQA